MAGRAVTMGAGSALTGKVIVVTGGASGIGRAAVKRCAALGARVVLGDVAEAEGEAVAAAVRAREDRALFVPCDVTSEAQCGALMAAALEAHGRLDVLIACAGILQGAFVDVADLEDERFAHVIDVNLRGAFLSVKHAVRGMDGGGVILLLASGAGVTGSSSSVAYGASKGAVHGLGLVLQPRLAGRGIRVNTVAPGAIATPLKEQNVRDAGRARDASAAEIEAAQRALGDPAGVARVLAFLASDDADYVRGTIFTR